MTLFPESRRRGNEFGASAAHWALLGVARFNYITRLVIRIAPLANALNAIEVRNLEMKGGHTLTQNTWLQPAIHIGNEKQQRFQKVGNTPSRPKVTGFSKQMLQSSSSSVFASFDGGSMTWRNQQFSPLLQNPHITGASFISRYKRRRRGDVPLA